MKSIRFNVINIFNSLYRWLPLLQSKIGFKLGALVGMLSLMSVIGGGASLYMIQKSESEFNHLFEDRMTPLEHILIVQQKTAQIRRILLSYMILMQEDEDTSDVLAQIKPLTKKVTKHWKLANLDAEDEVAKEFINDYEAIRMLIAEQTVFPLISAINSGDYEMAVMIESVSGELYDDLETIIDNIVEYLLSSARLEIEESIDDHNLFSLFIVVAVAVAVSIAFIFSLLIIRGITGSMNKAVTLTSNVSKGILTNEVNIGSADETGQMVTSLSAMSLNLRNIVSEVNKDINYLDAGSKSVVSSNENLADKIQEQTVSLNFTASNMDDVIKVTKTTADAAAEAHKLSEAAQKEARDGGKVIDEAIMVMSLITKSSGEISEITATIDSIAFQTNLLALNASVEAARAGDHGRGFAVVANEVRNLSQRVGKAAKEIKSLIDNSVTNIQRGNELVDQSGKSLAIIKENTFSVADIVKTINLACENQAVGIDEVNRAISEMNESFQDNSETIIKSTIAADDMAQKVIALVKLMSFFKVGNVKSVDA